jgi:transcriptional regulator with PAS, ATPase and Fis domain
MNLGAELATDPSLVYRVAMKSLFERLESLCEGAVAVDTRARIVWISDKYVKLLGLDTTADALGREVEDVIPNSLMREVVRTGEPILLDIMEFGAESFVVTRMPLTDEHGELIGAIGFVLYHRLHYLKPLVSKFAHLQSELANAERRLAEERRAKYTLSSLVGSSPALVELKRQARRAAQLDTTVLLAGETGTGKEMVAHALHAASPRAHQPFVAANVAAIPETLLEAEFFGAAPGAYTGAERKGRDGKFKLADRGTLFLDEVGDMPLPVQAKLLRVLQEQEIEPLGSNKVMQVDVRVITATSLDLAALVQQGKFRSDLYYRLNVLALRLPPLREHIGDLEAIAEMLLEQITARTGLPQRELSPSAVAALSAYPWPGNIRELRNALEKAVLHSERTRLESKDFASILPSRADPAPAVVPIRPLTDAVAEAERTAIRAALTAARGKKAAAAQLLGISRATLYEKLDQLGF